jgi:hypothetical protein
VRTTTFKATPLRQSVSTAIRTTPIQGGDYSAAGHLVALVDQALRQLVDVVLDTPEVGIEKIADHQYTVSLFFHAVEGLP